MKFEQAHVSKTLEPFFGEKFRKKWNLKNYFNPDAPAAFLGLYRSEDIEKFMSHKSERILIFGGSDIKLNTVSKIKKSFSDGRTYSWMYPGEISDLMLKYEVPHKTLYIALKDYSEFKPVALGDKIYVYRGAKKTNPEYFKWSEVVEPLIRYFGKERVLFTDGQDSVNLIDKFYSKSFVYVKPNAKGGNTTMWELGHMGIKTLGKGHSPALPNFLEYSDFNHLVSLIEKEEKNIGKTNHDLAEKVNSVFNKNQKWLTVDFWK